MCVCARGGVDGGGQDFAYSAVPPLVRPSDAHDTQAFPKFAAARCVDVELQPGEILYLPIYWWHGVSAGAGRNCILNWWFDMSDQKRDPGCHKWW